MTKSQMIHSTAKPTMSQCESSKVSDQPANLHSSRSEEVSTYYFFLFLDENVCCVYSLDALHRGASTEYPLHVFVKIFGLKKKRLMWSFATAQSVKFFHLRVLKCEKLKKKDAFTCTVQFRVIVSPSPALHTPSYIC